MDHNKYDPPQGPPPNYPQVHQDAGPVQSPPPVASPHPYYQSPANADYYGGQPQQGYPPQGYQQGGGYYPPQGYYGGQQQPMYYQQGPPPQGYYADNRGRGSGAAEGICAGLLGALACCCCLDFIF